ncbi:MAG: beta-ketoacyl-[acyl-carrier-protein] synthase II [Nitrospirae bacterium RBG_19FT_COMBO_42_15]|nr:MAG: beta-ketoacyl-[acyl-carrier-protein] synthase II [Nitrospirae bacterium RBG_19FT_COMBO_42_15]
MLTPLGIGVEKSWNAMCRGESGIDKVTQFDTTDMPSKIAGEIKGFDPADYIEQKEIKKMDRFIQLAVAASQMVMDDCALKITDENAPRIGTIVGAGMGGLSSIEFFYKRLLENGPRRVSPFFIPIVIINLAAGQIAIRFGLKGPNSAVATACASGTHAIGDAFKIIQRGDADAMVAGGSEACITAIGFAGFCAAKALSTNNDEPKKASRPFDAKRDGFVMGEAAGLLMLEELEFAQRRGARIYAEVVGYGMSGDAYHITAPSPDGDGAYRCMKAALEDSGLPQTSIQYINAHGTSTKFNDELETMAIKRLFKEYAYKIPVSSTKSMTGHMLGAGGGVEAVVSILTIVNGIIHPTINYEFPDPQCDLDYVPNKARQAKVDAAMSNSFGFGGTNASLVFKKFEK